MDKKLEKALSEMKAALDNKLATIQSNTEKPKPYSFLSQYYGSTPLYAVVGCMLEIITGNHTSYGYAGCNTQYRDCYALKIGGAYKDIKPSEIVTMLTDILNKNGITKGKEHYVKYDGVELGIIDDYGTNFSVIGFGFLIH